MGDDHNGQPRLTIQALKGLENVLGRLRVHRPRGLVGQKELGVVGQGDGNSHPLLFAAGKLPQPPVCPMGHAHQLQQVHGPLLLLLAAAPFGAEQHGHLHVLPRGQVGDQVSGVVLPDEAHRGPLIGHQLRFRQLEQVLAVHIQPPCRGPVQAADHVQKGGLAAAGVADDGNQLPGLHPGVQALESHDLDIFCLIDLDQVVAFDDGLPQLIVHG